MRKLFTNSTVLAVAIAAIAITAVWAARTFDQVITTGPGGGRPGIVSYSLVSSPFKVVTKTASYDITPTRDRTDPPGTTYQMNGSTLSLTFPTPSAALNGYWYRVKNINNTQLSLKCATTNPGQFRVGNSSAVAEYKLGAYANHIGAGAIVWCDGSKWNIDDASAPDTKVPWVYTKAADYTLISGATAGLDPCGAVYFTSTGPVTFTLPAPAAGLAGYNYRFINTVDANMTITCATEDKLSIDGNAASDSVVFSTASHKVGAAAYAICDGAKWQVQNVSTCTMTDGDVDD
jgi:hypothetical protein